MRDPARRKTILSKKEKKLLILLSKESSAYKIGSAAEEVREAKISFLKGQKKIAAQDIGTQNLELKKNISKHLANIEKNTKLWLSYSRSQIVELYEQKNT